MLQVSLLLLGSALSYYLWGSTPPSHLLSWVGPHSASSSTDLSLLRGQFPRAAHTNPRRSRPPLPLVNYSRIPRNPIRISQQVHVCQRPRNATIIVDLYALVVRTQCPVAITAHSSYPPYRIWTPCASYHSGGIQILSFHRSNGTSRLWSS